MSLDSFEQKVHVNLLMFLGKIISILSSVFRIDWEVI